MVTRSSCTMLRAGTILLFLWVIKFAHAGSLKSTACYWPNGEQWASHIPCQSSTADGHSMCCDPVTSICLDNGLCYEMRGSALRRETCTDSTWVATSCTSYCRATDPQTGVSVFSQNGSNFCCGGYDSFGRCTGVEGAFTLNAGNLIKGAGLLNTSLDGVNSLPAATTLIGSIIPTSTSPATTQCTDTCSNNNHDAAIIGASVGGPLGIGLIVAFIFLFLSRREVRKLKALRRSRVYEAPATISPIKAPIPIWQVPSKPNNLHHGRHEMYDKTNEPNQRREMMELPALPDHD